MTSFLGWIDGDPEHEAAVMRALRNAGSQDARDELGLGAIRDTFADAFFPGLSTIQTRSRYFLFIQWCCELASRHASEAQIISALHANEVAVIKALIRGGQARGVIGIEKQENLERMPSEIYWSGLRLTGMRSGSGTVPQWARQVVQARHAARERPTADGHAPSPDTGFSADRPDMPVGFPMACDLKLKLEPDEVRFLRARFAGASVDSRSPVTRYNLMKPYQRHRVRLPANVAIWTHPKVEQLDAEVCDMVLLAQAFAHVMHGAVLLYQRRVAELKVNDAGSALDVRDARAAGFADWVSTLEPDHVDRLSRHLSELLPLAVQTRHGLDERMLGFVRAWIERCRGGDDLLDDKQAVFLVSNRERRLKSGMGTSRIASAGARARWRGAAANPMDFRWATARTFLNDLAGAA